MKAQARGKLILFPVGIGNIQLNTCLPEYNTELLNTCSVFVVENLREARRFLVRSGYTHPIDETEFYLLNEHTREEDISSYLHAIDEGGNIGLLSDAGIPCVADPGSTLVLMAQKKNIEIIPLVGPSSLMLALMASGCNGQHFLFHGYLPIDPKERQRKIKEIEQASGKLNQTQLFIETPYRNLQMFKTLIETCSPNTLLCVATHILLPDQSILTKTIQEWRGKEPDIQKKNTVFILYANLV